MAPNTRTISSTENAAATLMAPCSTSLKISAVRIRQRGFVRKMIAERLVTCLAKLKLRPAMKAGRMSGRVTRRKV